MGETLSRFSENILEGRTRLIFDTKAFMGECRLFTARRSVIIITERDICFSPTVQRCLSRSFSSCCTHRGRISIPPTPGENRADIKAETFRVSRAGTPVKRAQPNKPSTRTQMWSQNDMHSGTQTQPNRAMSRAAICRLQKPRGSCSELRSCATVG